MTGMLPYSKRSIDRAGNTLRRTLANDGPPPPAEEIANAISLVEAYRRAHGSPMLSARMGLRSCIDTAELEVVELTQRLKRMPTVIDKLRRLPTMKLSRMQDTGGCRAVFKTQEEANLVQERFMANSVQRNGVDDGMRDYLQNPRSSGYRAVHILTRYSDCRIEVQLRTRMQHDWAKLVEEVTTITGIDYKSGDGADEVHDWLQLLSRGASFEEAGQDPYEGFEQDYIVARVRAQPFITRQRGSGRDRHG